MPKFARISVENISPAEDAPPPESVVSGNPRFKSWTVDEAGGGIEAGVWEATPGKWRFDIQSWEYCRILAGVSIITEDGGEAHTVREGDSFVLRPGIKGTWEVVETTRKDYVIRA